MSYLGCYLFVYGTLRAGCEHPMARFLAERARRIGSASVQGRLYNLGWHPGLLPASGPEEWVQGDLYELPEDGTILAELDRYETGASAQFERSQVPVVRPSGDRLTAWVYFYRGEANETQRILSGDYLKQNE